MREKLMLNVGRDERIQLEGLILEPNFTKAQSTIIFTPGISSHFEDYLPLLEPLAEEAHVVTYDLRGHGRSQGVFDPPKLVEDLEDIAKMLAKPVCAIGQSVGASIAASAANTQECIKGVYLITPYLCTDSLSIGPRCGVYLARALTYTGIPYVLDALLRRNKAFKNRTPIQDTGRLVKAKAPRCAQEKPTSWIVADHDAVLGTLNNPRHFDAVCGRLRELYPHGHDRSALAHGLNHCLNITPGDYAPFLKDEPGKNRDAIIADMLDFAKGVCASET